MAHLWKENSQPGSWDHVPLDAEHAFPLAAPGASAGAGGAALLLRSRTDDGDAWLLMAATSRGVFVNGVPLRTGIRILADRDEIRVAELGRLFFSTERLPLIEPFPAAQRAVYCPRCKQPVPAGDPAVRCPGCNRWYHQSSDWPCFTYTERCALCPQPSALDSGFRWCPDEL